jgi:type IV pilus assembly protein PilM
LGTSAVKLAEMKKNGKSWKLLHFGYVQLPEEAIINNEIMNPAAVVDAVKTLLRQIRLKNTSVCTSLVGTGVIVKRMTVEVPNAKELQEQVFWEAEQYLPFDVSEVYLDFQVLSRTKSGTTDVVLVAAKKGSVDSYIGAIEQSGLKAKIVDLDTFALQNVFEQNYPAKPHESVAIVDLGASAMRFSVIHQGVPVFNKETGMGGKALTQEIQRHLNLSFADAESLKVSGSTDRIPQEVADLIHISCENISGEIKRSIDIHNGSNSGAPIAYILLTGGGAKLPGISQMVEQQCGLPTQIMNPFSAIAYDSSHFSPEQLTAHGPLAAVPIGLAMRAGSK